MPEISVASKSAPLLTELDLAISYWREGNYPEAKRVILQAVRSETDAKQLLRLRMNLAIIEQELGRLKKAREILEAILPAAETLGDDFLIGRVQTEYGNTLTLIIERYSNLAYFDKAIMAYTAGSVSFDKSGHRFEYAAVESNFAYLYLMTGDPSRAHEHLDTAERVAEEIDDQLHLAWWRETRARVYIAEGRLHAALDTITLSLDYLEGSDKYGYLAAALVTFGVIQARLDHAAEARHTFARALWLHRKTGAATGEVRRKIYGELQECHRRQQERHERLELKFEEKRFRQALRESGKRVTNAARLLGMPHGSFISRLKYHPELESERNPPALPRGRHARKS